MKKKSAKSNSFMDYIMQFLKMPKDTQTIAQMSKNGQSGHPSSLGQILFETALH
jgi:hypothetical protein